MTDLPPRFAPAATVTEAQRLLDHGAPEEAATLLAGAAASAPDDELELWQGLALLTEGLTQVTRRDNDAAARSLRRGADLLGAHTANPPHALDVPGLIAWAEHLVTELDEPAASARPDRPPVPRLRLP
ncbi:DUF309 domain-containing protein [Rhodococcus sp. NPDC058532]|uniref:DUF309 domain-containing protein n=1 Tax=Rhodococcus sp. NPDC058532 TaxID=3346540 RepID=UPI00365AA82C